MDSLKLYWLGPARIELAGQAVKPETRKSQALLAYLSLLPEPCPRELLATLFWPEADQQKALSNLRRTLFSLNSRLPGWIAADRQSIFLTRNDKLSIDVDSFHGCLAAVGDHLRRPAEPCEQCLTTLTKAVTYYRGDFLEAFNLDDCPNFDEWQFFQRDTLRQELSKVLRRLTEIQAVGDQLDDAILTARRWLALDRPHEPACRALMELYARAGQRTAAFRQYEELVGLLQGQEPELETRELHRRIQMANSTESPAVAMADRDATLPLLKTKLYIPTAPIPGVIRSALLVRLSEVEHYTLTLLSAPAGFGKTTLLAQWIAQSPLPVAWLSLDAGDNDPYRFLEYLIAALQGIDEQLGLGAEQLLRSPQLVPPHIILASLINDLGRMVEPCALVLDDCQFIAEHGVHEALAYLIDHLPGNTHLVIATRSDPPIPLGRLRAHGQLLEFRTEDLRFTPREAIDLLNDVLKLGVSEKNVQALEDKTEGWVVGLKMAAVSLRNRAEQDGFIHAFSGSNRFVVDYLLDEVLASQETHVVQFLIATSILDRLNGSLCDAILGEGWSGDRRLSGQEMLEYLESTNMLVVPLDDQRVWYRYHHLFADLLRTRVGRYSSDQISKFRIRASRWCEEHDLTLEAIKYALEGGDAARAAVLIDGMSRLFISPADFGELQSYIGCIPADIAREHPWTCLAQTHIWVTLGKVDAVEEWLDRADSHEQTAQQQGGQRDDDIAATIALHRAYVRLFHNDLSGAAELGAAALRTLQPSQPRLRCRLTLLVGEAFLLQGSLDSSNTYLREAIERSKTIPDMFLLTTACYRLTIQLKLQGKLGEAENIYKEIIQILNASNLGSSHLMTKPQIGLGDIYRERGQLRIAEDLLAAGTQRAELLGHSEDLVYAYSLMARLMQAQGKIEQALGFLDKNIALFHLNPVPEAIVQGTKYLRDNILLSCGSHGNGILLSPPVIDVNAKIGFLNELDFTTLARSLILHQDYAPAIELLTRLAQVAEEEGRVERLIKALILQAMALHQCGAEDKAKAVLSRCLLLGKPEGYQRIFLDEGEPFLRLLNSLDVPNTAPQLQDFVERLLEAGGDSAPPGI